LIYSPSFPGGPSTSRKSVDYSRHTLDGKEILPHPTGQLAVQLHIKMQAPMGQIEGRRKTMVLKKKATKKPKRAKAVQHIKPLKATVTHIQ
jgi:hypothetical protein